MPIVETISSEYPVRTDSLYSAYGKDVVVSFGERMYIHLCRRYKNANYIDQVEWTLRCFNAAKRITTSSLFYTQALYLLDKNCRNLVFHNLYYALLHSYLANLYLVPHISINQIADRNSERLYLTHDRVRTDIDNYFIRFNLLIDGHNSIFNQLRLFRELYSYHLPLQGSFVQDGKNIDHRSFINKVDKRLESTYQLVDLISYVGFYAWDRKAPPIKDDYANCQQEVDDIFFSFIEHHDKLGQICLIDNDDYRRQGWAIRNFKGPFPVSWVIPEKICEDLECGWDLTTDEDLETFDITGVADYICEYIG